MDKYTYIRVLFDFHSFRLNKVGKLNFLSQLWLAKGNLLLSFALFNQISIVKIAYKEMLFFTIYFLTLIGASMFRANVGSFLYNYVVPGAPKVQQFVSICSKFH